MLSATDVNALVLGSLISALLPALSEQDLQPLLPKLPAEFAGMQRLPAPLAPPANLLPFFPGNFLAAIAAVLEPDPDVATTEFEAVFIAPPAGSPQMTPRYAPCAPPPMTLLSSTMSSSCSCGPLPALPPSCRRGAEQAPSSASFPRTLPRRFRSCTRRRPTPKSRRCST